MSIPPRRFQVYRHTGRSVDTDAWQLLEMAELYRCIEGFQFDPDREVFYITESPGRVHTMSSEQVQHAYAESVVDMVDSLREADTSGEEFTTETGVNSPTPMVPYIPELDDRREIYPQHWQSPHG